MHSNKIAHRDIKPENILIDDIHNLQIKLTDFGFATYFDEKDKMDEVLGSPLYMPPEIVKHEKYTSKVDVWSAGVVTYILLCGRPPFFGTTKDEVYNSIKNDTLSFKTNEWAKISDDAKEFIRLSLNKDPDQRSTAEDLLNHTWMLQEKMMQESNEEQLVAVSANMHEFTQATNFQKTIVSILAGLKVQQEELGDLKQAFLTLDQNNDGTLSMQELQQGLGNLCMFEIMQDHHADDGEDCFQRIMDLSDLDGDGKIDYIEFI